MAVSPIRLGNVSIPTGDGTQSSIKKGICVYLLDQAGNRMALPAGTALPPELVKMCNRLATDLLQNAIAEIGGAQDIDITGFNDHLITGLSGTAPVSYEHQEERTWQKLERTILSYFWGERIDVEIEDPHFDDLERRSVGSRSGIRFDANDDQAPRRRGHKGSEQADPSDSESDDSSSATDSSDS